MKVHCGMLALMSLLSAACSQPRAHSQQQASTAVAAASPNESWDTITERNTDGFTMSLSDSLSVTLDADSAFFCRHVAGNGTEFLQLVLPGDDYELLIKGFGPPLTTRELRVTGAGNTDDYQASVVDRSAGSDAFAEWKFYDAEFGTVRIKEVSPARIRGTYKISAHDAETGGETDAIGAFQATPARACGGGTT